MKLDGKVAIITGGSKGIGEETARTFLDNGAKVVIADVDQEAGDQLIEQLNANGQALFVKVDVTSSEEVENLVDVTMEKFGRVDILVNNAGITIDGFLTDMPEEQWQKVIDVNLTGVYKCSKLVADIMIKQESGVILSPSSVVGIYGNVGQTNYAATKAGLIGLTKSWAKELGPKGIRVNAIAPGFIETDMTSKVPEKVLNKMKEKTPLKKLGKPKDIAAAYLFLASDDASYINGTVLSVDGGLVV
ncbi:3-oxoacyl-ACP reductase FabG [Alteribacillus sp. YIM 98480]|uniref:3-oxoacyl-ACP reductase FabG n=1 Tax=Alteribacillus sp. YIM 98480 TaxID=2606599 RepID=UPI00131B99FE|nr:3-oxoacyl-ACP reductase FabG [Alteribacillus sp. YIM 98480]